jgi:hypothetical protein
MPRISIRALAFAASAAFALACLGWSPAAALQRTLTIYQIQDTTAVGRHNYGSTDTVTTTGVLVASDTRSAFGFILQDPAGGPFSGIAVVGQSNMFADSLYARGDLITVTGRVSEFNGETQMLPRSGNAFNGVPITTKIGTAALPPAIALPNFGAYSELAAYQFAEKYEGVRISLTNARAVRNLFPETWLGLDNNVPGSTDTVRVDGFTLCWPNVVLAPAAGVVATSVQGIGGQNARGYGINMRDVADIVVPSPPSLINAWATSNTNIRLLFDRPLDPLTSQDESKYSRVNSLGAIDLATLVGGENDQVVDLTTTTDPQIPGEAEKIRASAIKSALGVAMPAAADQTFRAGITPIQQVQTNAVEDTSQYVTEQVTVRAIVHARDGSLYYIQDGTGTNPSSGMALFGAVGALSQGDDVTLSGIISEFGAASQLTEFTNVNYQFLNATGVAKYTPVVVSPGAIGTRTGAEPYPGEAYEAMFVELQNVTVVQDSLPNGQFVVQGGGGAGDTVRVDDTMFRQDYLYNNGDDYLTVVPFLRGMVNDAFGQYTVNPRDSADISDQLVAVEPGAGAVDFAIRSVTPTPVSFARGGAALVSFNLPTAGRASMRVYDVAGRLVSTPLSNVDFAAGPQSVALDARSLGGGRLGSGIFFVQLQLGNRLATAKLVVTD